MRWIFTFLILGVFTTAVAGPRLVGLDRLVHFERLPELLEGVQVRQVSSYDRSGGNDDGFSGTYSALYVDEAGEYVLFDEIGSGCLYRFWMTYDEKDAQYPFLRIRFYFDHETTPRLDLSVDDFFDGVGVPLEFPLVGRLQQSSHGHYCYVPFPYQTRLKVTLSGLPLFYNMTYHCYDSSDGVTSWTGQEDQTAVMAQWNAVGQDPKSTASNLVGSGNLQLGPSATGTLFSASGSGAIQSIKLDPSPSTTHILSNVWLEMNWDGGDAEVEVPLGHFFGSGRHEMEVAALPLGMTISGDWYCYFPMPYWEQAEIRLINRGTEALNAVPFTIQYTTNVYDRAANGYFCAHFNEETFVDDGRDFLFLDEQGWGHLVGISLFMESSGGGGYQDMAYLEGDERAYIDGNRSPCIHGTGNEDYFNAGWYFNQGAFSRPLHGCPWRDQFHTDRPNQTQAYRFHVTDTLPFRSSIRFGVEHGDGNHTPGTYSSVAYFYKAARTDGGVVPMADLDVGNDWSAQLLDFRCSGQIAIEDRAFAYPGDDNGALIQDDGYELYDMEVAFTVPLIENAGLLLRRRTARGGKAQHVRVYVDDVLAGSWYDADENFSGLNTRWFDSEFMVQKMLIDGKKSARIRLVPESGSSWNIYYLWAYCMKPRSILEDVDQDGLPDGWEINQCGEISALSALGDFDGDGSCDMDEYIAGTAPANSGSLFLLSPAVPVHFKSEVGRLYQLDQCTHLRSNEWKTVWGPFPGTGQPISVPIHSMHDAEFFRMTVEKP